MGRMTFDYMNVAFSVGIAASLYCVGCGSGETQQLTDITEADEQSIQDQLQQYQQQVAAKPSSQLVTMATQISPNGQVSEKPHLNPEGTTTGNETQQSTAEETVQQANDSEFNVGDPAEVEWSGTWYAATVLDVEKGQLWRIHYDGWSDDWDETVEADRIRRVASNGAAQSNSETDSRIQRVAKQEIENRAQQKQLAEKPAEETSAEKWSFEEGGRLKGHTDQVSSVAFSPDGKTLASGSFDNTIKLWDLQTGIMKHTLTGHRNDVNVVAFSPDGKLLASASDDYTVKLWDPQTGSPGATLKAHREGIKCLAFSPDGRRLVSKDYEDGIIALWDTRLGRLREEIEDGAWVSSVVFSPDGKTVVWDDDIWGGVYTWDLQKGESGGMLFEGGSSQLAFSPDGKTLVSANGSTIDFRDAQTGTLLKTIVTGDESTYTIAFSPDGKTLASSSGESSLALPSETSIKFWESETGKLKGVHTVHSVVDSIAFSPDGKLMAVDGAEKDKSAISVFQVASITRPKVEASLTYKEPSQNGKTQKRGVEWSLEGGGNGHFYEAVVAHPGISWDYANQLANAAGGYLVTITSKEENDFVFALIDKPDYWNASRTASDNVLGPWIGCVQASGSTEPNGGWSWVNGEGFGYANWDAQQPNNWGSVDENRVIFGLQPYRKNAWCDVRRDHDEVKAYVIEYDIGRDTTDEAVHSNDSSAELAHANGSDEAVSQSPPLARTDYYHMQGIWQVVTPEKDDQSQQIDSKVQMQFEGWTLGVQSPGRKESSWLFLLDSASTPCRFDLFTATGVEPAYQGIYEFDGDRLMIRMAKRGKERPSDMFIAEDDGSRIYVLDRTQTVASKSPDTSSKQVLDQIVAYYGGSAGKVDESRAAQLIRELAATGDPLGRMWFARCLFKGRGGFDQDNTKAEQIAGEVTAAVEQLAKQGDEHAAFLWASALVDGLGTNRDGQISEAAAYQHREFLSVWNPKYSRDRRIHQLNEQRRPGAERASQQLMREKYPPDQHREKYLPDKQRAAKWYRVAAEKGHTIAAYNLHFLYEKSDREVEAAQWLRRAAEAGDASGMNNLGYAYEFGEFGLNSSNLKTRMWYERAANTGLALAQENLANDNNPSGYRGTNQSYPYASLGGNYSVQPLPQSRYSGPGWDEDARYEEYKLRQSQVELRQKFNQHVAPGFQPIPRNALGWGP